MVGGIALCAQRRAPIVEKVFFPRGNGRNVHTTHHIHTVIVGQHRAERDVSNTVGHSKFVEHHVRPVGPKRRTGGSRIYLHGDVVQHGGKKRPIARLQHRPQPGPSAA